MSKCNCSSKTCAQKEEDEIEMFSLKPTEDFFTKYKTPLISGLVIILLLVMFVVFLKRHKGRSWS